MPLRTLRRKAVRHSHNVQARMCVLHMKTLLINRMQASAKVTCPTFFFSRGKHVMLCVGDFQHTLCDGECFVEQINA